MLIFVELMLMSYFDCQNTKYFMIRLRLYFLFEGLQFKEGNYGSSPFNYCSFIDLKKLFLMSQKTPVYADFK